jgi:hypothetical protein
MTDVERGDEVKIEAEEDFSLRITRTERRGDVVRKTTFVLNAKGGVMDKILAYAFGIVFVATILVIAIFFPDPTDFQYTVFRITLALAAGGVAAVVPGFIQVKFRNWLRAGGALAVFVIVYLVAPAAMEKNDPPPTKAKSPQSAPK